MNLNVNVPKVIEERLKARAAASGKDVEAYVLEVVRESLDRELPEQARSIDDATFKKLLSEIQERHKNSPPDVDDSRESIYAGRGE